MPTVEAQLQRTERKVTRLRWYVVILSGLIVFFGIVVPVFVTASQRQTTENAVVQIACISLRNQVAQLEALAALERRLGIPVDFKIPPITEECP